MSRKSRSVVNITSPCREHNLANRAATGEPVGLVINHHNHAWVMTGFESSTDPAVDRGFKLTAVYIMGPLYPRPPHNGMDPPPDTRLTYQQMKSFLNRYFGAAEDPNNPWEGTYVTIQP